MTTVQITISDTLAKEAATEGLLAEQLVDRLDEPWNVDVHRIPKDAMVDQVVAVDEVISRARDVLPGDIIAALLEFVW